MKQKLELTVESRPFVNRVNDQVRKRQKRSSMNVTEDREKHSIIWRMFMSVTLESPVFMGKNYLNYCHSIANTTDLTLKQMIDISTKLVSEQDVISGLETIGWENHSWKYLSLIGEERIINLQRTKVYVFSDSVLCLGEIQEKPNRTMAREMGSPRQAKNRRRWTREGPELVCVQTPAREGWHTQGRKDELTSCRGTVQSAWQKPPVGREGGRTGLPTKGKWSPRGTGKTVLIFPAQQPAVFRWQ